MTRFHGRSTKTHRGEKVEFNFPSPKSIGAASEHHVALSRLRTKTRGVGNGGERERKREGR